VRCELVRLTVALVSNRGVCELVLMLAALVSQLPQQL
jgi:hypothetical protein